MYVSILRTSQLQVGEWGQIGLGSLGSISVSLWGTVKIKIKDFREVLTVSRGMIDDPLMTTSLTPLEPPLQSYWRIIPLDHCKKAPYKGNPYDHRNQTLTQTYLFLQKFVFIL